MISKVLKMGECDYLVKDSFGMYFKMLPKAINRSVKAKHLEGQKEQVLEALRESQKRYERLEENLPDNFIYSHGVDGVFTYISPSVKKVLGYSPEEFKQHYSTYMTEHPINKKVDMLTQLSISGKPQKPYEVEVFHNDGNVRRLLVSEIPVFDEHGKVTSVEGLARDISRSEQVRVDLLKSEKIYRTIVEKSPNLIIQLDPDRKITFVNSAMKLLGYEPDDLIGSPLGNIIVSDEMDSTLSQLVTKSVGPMATVDLAVKIKVNPESAVAEHMGSARYSFFATGLWSISDEDVFNKVSDGVFWGTLCIGQKV